MQFTDLVAGVLRQKGYGAMRFLVYLIYSQWLMTTVPQGFERCYGDQLMFVFGFLSFVS
jgi:hypothetical protein